MKMVREVKKAKPFAVLPGSGMSIDVVLKRGDKVCYIVYQMYTLNLSVKRQVAVTIMYS